MKLNATHLPDWPAETLVREAVISYGLRHLKEVYIDYRTAPWETIQKIIGAFLRHRLSSFDQQLQVLEDYNETYRDELAAEIQRAAFRKYKWLTSDPRPFPQAKGGVLFLDRLARELARLHSAQDDLQSALSELRRAGNSPKQLADLESLAARIAKRIRTLYAFLTEGNSKPDEEGNYGRDGRALVLPLKEEAAYYFFSDRPVPLNRLTYLGFQCSRCGASVARCKNRVDWGQRHDRMVISSCHCTLFALYEPRGFHVRLLTAADWEKFLQEAEENRTDKNQTEVNK
jgi:hypothetical protein